MRKKISMLTAAALVAANAVPAFAATTYTPVAGTSKTFDKFLIMDEGDTVPNATFSFTVAPGEAVSASTADNAVMQVLPGVGNPTIADVTFAPSDSATSVADADAIAALSEIDVKRTAGDRVDGGSGDTVQLDAGEKFAKKTATIDFSSVTFNEPGIYRYIIRETANADHAAAGIIHDTDTDRVLDVYVVHKDAQAAVTEAWIYGDHEYATEDDAKAAAGEGNYSSIVHREASEASEAGLAVAAYVLHTSVSDPVINTTMGSGDVSAAGDALDDKTDGFTNEYSSKDLKIMKEVSGNQASRDKYFELTATFTAGVNDNDSYQVSIADDQNAITNDGSADATSGSNAATIAANTGKANPTTVTGAQLKAGQKFYLQHGQYVVIRGLAPNANYTVTENAEDYASAAKEGATNTGVIGTVAGDNKMALAGFTNTRDGVIPTGVLMTILPFAALTAIGIGGLALTRKKNDEE